MVAANKTIEMEGTWEEILKRGHDLAGRRVRVTVLAEAPPPETSGETLDQILAPLIAQAAVLRKDPQPPGLHGLSEEFAEGVAEHLRKQGLKT